MEPEEVFARWIESEQGVSCLDDATDTEDLTKLTDVLRDTFLAGWRKCQEANDE